MGQLSRIPAPQLGGIAIAGALKKAAPALAAHGHKVDVDEVFMGQVIQAGVGQAPARQASLGAGLPESVPCTTVNKVCGSGLKAIIMGAQTIAAGDNQIVVAGGMENMSLAPHFLGNSRRGTKWGKLDVQDALLWDGLRDAGSGQMMGSCAEECEKKYNFGRQAQDEFAIESFKRAQKSIEEGLFKDEIVPVTTTTVDNQSMQSIKEDEGPFKANFDKIPILPPAFEKEGTITAANASTISDGAAAVVLAGEALKSQAKFKIVSYGSHAQHPTWFTTAPIEAMRKCLSKAGIGPDEVDLFEINEAFAVVTMAAMKEFNLDHGKVNIYGGGISLGHPLGNSGTRIVVTLMNAMEKNKVQRGMASLCIGGGEALALLLERLS